MTLPEAAMPGRFERSLWDQVADLMTTLPQYAPSKDSPTALITGAGTGIGRLAALDLAKRGYRLLLAGRTLARLESTRRAIIDSGTHCTAECIELDLADLASVRSAAQQVLKHTPRLSLLINNAGVAGERGISVDGFERAFAINHLGHFALTLRVWPALVAASAPRVITVASRAHRHAPGGPWDSVRGPTRSLTGIPEYGRSKLANILFAAELARRARPWGVFSCSLHPGVLDTEIWRRLPGWLRRLNRWRLDSAEKGSHAIVHAATEASDEANGQYLDGTLLRLPSPLGRDSMLAHSLWTRSLEWTALDDPTSART
jgi:NAD(P)-dependent dehydrogenase (short-subunit alcohol dehydrogenase family)